MNKISIKAIGNNERFNHVTLEKSPVFLDILQDFISDSGIAKVEEGIYEFEGKSYDRTTFNNLFYEEPIDHKYMIKYRFEDYDQIYLRYPNKDVELIIIFFKDKIDLIFYCDPLNRKKIIDSLLKFCEFSLNKNL